MNHVYLILFHAVPEKNHYFLYKILTDKMSDEIPANSSEPLHDHNSLVNKQNDKEADLKGTISIIYIIKLLIDLID